MTLSLVLVVTMTTGIIVATVMVVTELAQTFAGLSSWSRRSSSARRNAAAVVYSWGRRHRIRRARSGSVKRARREIGDALAACAGPAPKMSGIDPASRKRLRDSHVDLLRLRARLGGVEDRPFGRSQADALMRPYVPSAQWRVVVWTVAPEGAYWRASAGRAER